MKRYNSNLSSLTGHQREKIAREAYHQVSSSCFGVVGFLPSKLHLLLHSELSNLVHSAPALEITTKSCLKL